MHIIEWKPYAQDNKTILSTMNILILLDRNAYATKQNHAAISFCTPKGMGNMVMVEK